MSYNSDESSSSISDNSYYKTIQYADNNENDKNNKNEQTYYIQLKQRVDEKIMENQNEEMKLQNLQNENSRLKDEIDEMNEMICIYKKQMEEYGINIKDLPIYNHILKQKNKRYGEMSKNQNEYSKVDTHDDNLDESYFNENNPLNKSKMNEKSIVLEDLSTKRYENEDNDLNDYNKERELKEMIYVELADILKEFEFKVNEYEEIKIGESNEPIQNISVKACCVYKINDSDTSEVKSECQTFRVNHNTTPAIVYQHSVLFWKLPNDNNYYKLYFIDHELSLIELNQMQMNTVLDTFIKQNSNMRRLLFVLASKNAVFNKDELGKLLLKGNKNESSQVEKKESINKSIQRFFKYFTGQGEYMEETYLKLKKEDFLKKKNKNNIEIEDYSFGISTITRILSFMFLPLIMLTFLVLTIYGLFNLRPESLVYMNTQSVKSLINLNNTLISNSSSISSSSYWSFQQKSNDDQISFLNFDEFINNLLFSFDNFFPESKIGGIGKSEEIIYFASSLRLGHYYVKEKTCNNEKSNSNTPENSSTSNSTSSSLSNSTSKQKCYPILYNLNTQNTETIQYNFINSIVDRELKSLEKLSKDTFLKKYYIRKANSNLNALDTNDPQSTFREYIQYILSTWSETKSNQKFSYEGRLGDYSGYGNSIYISLPDINIEVYRFIIDKVLRNNKEIFMNGALRGFYQSFTILNYQSRRYYYISILYEFNHFNKISLPDIKVTQFKPEIFNGSPYESIMIMDIFRLVFSIILFISAIRTYYIQYKALKNRSMSNLFLIGLNPKFILPLIIFILYIIVFSIKFSSLNTSPNDYLSQTSISKTFHTKSIQDNYFLVKYYLYVITLDSFILLLLISMTLVLQENILRFEIFFSYIFQSIKTYLLFIFMLIFIYISFAIYANVLFGYESNIFRDFEASLIAILLVSSGHSKYFSSLINDNSSVSILEWKTFYITIFVFFLLFLFLSSFLGIYYLAYRIVSIREKPLYSERILNSINEDEKEGSRKLEIN